MSKLRFGSFLLFVLLIATISTGCDMVVGPSPTMTVSPTASPTQGYTTWADFMAHEKIFGVQLKADMDSINSVDTKDPNVVQILLIGAEKIRADMAEEQIWLKNQRPELCYKTFYDDLFILYRRVEASMNDLIESRAYGSFVLDWSAVTALANKYADTEKVAEANCGSPQPSSSGSGVLTT
jgi:hypothetical protein